jgi:bifunctional DNA-binding transcriptional regulator/antitoxin component of YhaV-PrlF toxin-antitoxin module
MASETRVSKGFLTVVPKSIRTVAKVQTGDRLRWTFEGGRIVVTARRRRTLLELKGLISHGGDAVKDKHRVQKGQT